MQLNAADSGNKVAKMPKMLLTNLLYEAIIRIKKSHKCEYGGDKMVNIDKLKGKIAENRMTVLALASKTGISKDTLYRRMSEGESFTVGEVDKISQALHLSVEDINAIFFSQYVA